METAMEKAMEMGTGKAMGKEIELKKSGNVM